MVKLNPNLAKLQSNYLFPEVLKRKEAFLKEHPNAPLISLSIGDTTEPIPSSISQAMMHAAENLSSYKTYKGYGPEQGHLALREKIASTYYPGIIDADDIFINDGAKCDLGRLQAFFGPYVKVALQDPAYPVYIDGSVIAGQTGNYNAQNHLYDNLSLMPCTPANHFFPDLSHVPKVDLIYFCSPHNPTGMVATREQLEKLVRFAEKNHSIIIYDSAYSFYIQDPSLPKSIYEIEGAKKVAIEVSSFSKLAGFTGVRLGWTIIPKELLFDEGSPVKNLWKRYIATIYNGASNIAQYGGLACLSTEGQQEINQMLQFYLENARILKKAIDQKFTTYSEVNAPYIWAYCGPKDSWDYFNDLLHHAHIVTVPGSGFGKFGQGFLRFSSFNSRENILEAADRLMKLNQQNLQYLNSH